MSEKTPKNIGSGGVSVSKTLVEIMIIFVYQKKWEGCSGSCTFACNITTEIISIKNVKKR